MVQTVTDNHTAVSDVIAWELDGNHRPSRENVTIAASQSLVNGQAIAFDGSGNVIKFSVQATNAAAGIYIGDSVVTGSGQTARGALRPGQDPQDPPRREAVQRRGPALLLALTAAHPGAVPGRRIAGRAVVLGA